MKTLDEITMERVLEEFERRCYDNLTHAMETEEGLGIEYDEDVVCDVCQSPPWRGRERDGLLRQVQRLRPSGNQSLPRPRLIGYLFLYLCHISLLNGCLFLYLCHISLLTGCLFLYLCHTSLRIG